MWAARPLCPVLPYQRPPQCKAWYDDTAHGTAKGRRIL